MTCLLGMPLSRALAVLRESGIEPQVEITRAPRRTDDAAGEMRIVRICDSGARLVAASFDIKRDFHNAQ